MLIRRAEHKNVNDRNREISNRGRPFAGQKDKTYSEKRNKYQSERRGSRGQVASANV